MSANVTATAAEYFTFGTEDYVVFILMLLLSSAIGIYFGFFAKSADTTDEYLLGGKRIKTLPIAISLVASQLSGISIMAVPAEIYSFGITHTFGVFAIFTCVPILCLIVIPVFYKNNISNCYEYLELRFNKKTRRLATVLFVLTVYMMLPVFIFIPALAFSQVTGVNIHLINGIVCFICVFYTMLGGIKAVVWTDVIQGLIMLFSVLLVGVIGTHQVGGLSKVIDLATKGGRLQPKALIIFGLGFLLISGLNCFIGVILFSKYYGCDPVKAGAVEKPDKLMPYFVQDIVGHLKGLPGIFISAVFSAALSTMSANLNSLSGIFYFDYVKPYINHTEHKANMIMRAFVFVTGCYCLLGGLVVGKFKSIVQMIVTISGITHGGIFGVFMLGMFIPKAHGKAAFYGVLFSIVVLLWIIIGSQLKFQSGKLRYDPLPTRIDECDAYNITVSNSIFKNPTQPPHNNSGNDGFSPYDISFHWYKVIGALCVWLVAVPLSYLTAPDKNDKELDPKLITPIIQRFIHRKYLMPEEVALTKKSTSKKMAIDAPC